ncbi:MAG TPA: hypothetical protein ENN84_09160, partial [Candidatus Marinimicrobia bacterium]|nr:hypothetical protein [Candidatus Neomarinimicrobiota bacterium]
MNLEIEGELSFLTVPEIKKKADKLIRRKRLKAVDLSKITQLDSAGVAFINHLIKYSDTKIDSLPKNLLDTYQIFTHSGAEFATKPKKENIFVGLADQLINFFSSSRDALYLTSEIVFWSFVGLFSSRGQRKGSLIHQAFLIGANAVGIIVLLSLIIGVILALQSAAQLR